MQSVKLRTFPARGCASVRRYSGLTTIFCNDNVGFPPKADASLINSDVAQRYRLIAWDNLDRLTKMDSM